MELLSANWCSGGGMLRSQNSRHRWGQQMQTSERGPRAVGLILVGTAPYQRNCSKFRDSLLQAVAIDNHVLDELLGCTMQASMFRIVGPHEGWTYCW